ncbi:hypothetical protein AALO_G00159960, partial [Alosa alosa]
KTLIHTHTHSLCASTVTTIFLQLHKTLKDFNTHTKNTHTHTLCFYCNNYLPVFSLLFSASLLPPSLSGVHSLFSSIPPSVYSRLVVLSGSEWGRRRESG